MTVLFVIMLLLIMDFNSHAHVERDKNPNSIMMWCDISTHTLTWSVTQTLTASHALMDISTHTLTWSVTPIAYLKKFLSINFNSHAHVERDTRYIMTAVRFANFNSHAHVERD